MVSDIQKILPAHPYSDLTARIYPTIANLAQNQRMDEISGVTDQVWCGRIVVESCPVQGANRTWSLLLRRFVTGNRAIWYRKMLCQT